MAWFTKCKNIFTATSPGTRLSARRSCSSSRAWWGTSRTTWRTGTASTTQQTRSRQSAPSIIHKEKNCALVALIFFYLGLGTKIKTQNRSWFSCYPGAASLGQAGRPRAARAAALLPAGQVSCDWSEHRNTHLWLAGQGRAGRAEVYREQAGSELHGDPAIRPVRQVQCVTCVWMYPHCVM